MTGKKILIGVVAVAVVALVYYAVAGWPPSDGGQATIGQVKRDVTPQIAEKDVVLKDPEFVAFMQTDFFHKLVTDEEFRNRVQDGSLAQAVSESQSLGVVVNTALSSRQTQESLRQSNRDAALAAVKESVGEQLSGRQQEALGWALAATRNQNFITAAKNGNEQMAAEAIAEALAHSLAQSQQNALGWALAATQNQNFITAAKSGNEQMAAEAVAEALAHSLAQTQQDALGWALAATQDSNFLAAMNKGNALAAGEALANQLEQAFAQRERFLNTQLSANAFEGVMLSKDPSMVMAWTAEIQLGNAGVAEGLLKEPEFYELAGNQNFLALMQSSNFVDAMGRGESVEDMVGASR